MKKLLYPFLFFTLCTYYQALSQKIHLTDVSNRWTIQGSTWAGTPITVISRDSIEGNKNINGQDYYLLGGIAIREDTALHKVFVKFQDRYDTTEAVLYDYNLKPGDSIWHIKRNSTSQVDSYLHQVVAVDTVSINGYEHKIWIFHYIGNVQKIGSFPNYAVIEGIGCQYGFYFPFAPWVFESGLNIICFSNADNTIVTVPNKAGGGYYLSAASCALGVADNSVSIPGIIGFYPNPINQHSKFFFPKKCSSGNVMITNQSGQIIQLAKLTENTNFSLGHLIAGIYFYKFVDDRTGMAYNGRFIVQ